jgi:hypothetical protein
MEKNDNEELHNLNASPNIIKGVIKPRRMRWAGHVALTGEMRYRILVRNLKGRDHS